MIIIILLIISFNKFLKNKSKTLLDLGANNGEFSRLLVKDYCLIISSDIDPLAVEQNYQIVKNNQESNILPLLIDLVNPSPSLGFGLSERDSIITRLSKTEVIMALALIHHLCITFNLPFEKISNLFASIGQYLIIEFVPKQDSQVQLLLKNRDDIFDDYSVEIFEKTFTKYFKIVKKINIDDSLRIMYLMEKR